MTISRFDRPRTGWKLVVGHVGLWLGFATFAGCWAVGWQAQTRVLGHAEFKKQMAARPYAIEMKGSTFFVEPAYGERYALSQKLIMFGFAIFAGAGLYLNGGRMRHSK
jgi:hypothetical protein